MSDSTDPVSEIVAAGREVVSEDVEALWSDLMDGRSTAQETSTRAHLLIETMNMTHMANWGLSTLYALTYEGARDAEGVGLAHERWRRHVRDYEADPAARDRRYYQRMIDPPADGDDIARRCRQAGQHQFNLVLGTASAAVAAAAGAATLALRGRRSSGER
jgi:hypothetical protein